jgi:aminopeptidase I
MRIATPQVLGLRPISPTCLNTSTLIPDDNDTPFSKEIRPEDYTKPFCDFMTNNPTVFHTVAGLSSRLESHGYVKLSERQTWNSKLKRGGKYYCTRNGSALIAFAVGEDYENGNGFGIVAGHIDALTAKLKPIPKLPTKEGFVQLGVAPYAGGMNNTWWDRDLGIGGRVLVKDSSTGKITTKLVKLDWPIARLPTLAPHFGAAAAGPFNKETQMVPIVGLDNSDIQGGETKAESHMPAGTFAATQPERLVRAIAGELSIQDCTPSFPPIILPNHTNIPQTPKSCNGNSNSTTSNPPRSAAYPKNSSSPAA